MSAQVFCPGCGVGFAVIPQIAVLDHIEGKRIVVTWFQTEFEHRCTR